MKKTIAFTFFFMALLVSMVYIIQDPDQGAALAAPVKAAGSEVTMKQDLLCLMLAYPEHVTGIERSADQKVYLILKSGKKLLYDDKVSKSGEGKLSNPDLQDMLEQPYPMVTTGVLMDMDFDPGRARSYALLKEAYGGSQQQIEKQLGNVFGMQFNKSNGAAASLKSAMEEVSSLAKINRKVSAAAFPTSGTYNYRVIAGTNRLSPHAFGIAIDLARDKSDYWQWATREEGQKRLETYPKELVEIFERHNFVWGGKWGHFDILHFEYRPEIILKARYFGEGLRSEELWYKGAPEDEKTQAVIRKIEEILE